MNQRTLLSTPARKWSWPRVGGIGLLALAAAWGGARAIGHLGVRREVLGAISSPVLPVLSTLPPFTLTERSGQVVTLADLRGSVWVATFFFTRCQDTCPLQVARMATLATDFAHASRLRLVAITVDPGHDTPEVLTTYAARLGLDQKRLLLLTGGRGQIAALARQGFKLAVGEVAQDGSTKGGVLIAHSDRLALVDADGRLRGAYESRDPEALQRFWRDLSRLLDEPPDGPVAGRDASAPSAPAMRKAG